MASEINRNDFSEIRTQTVRLTEQEGHGGEWGYKTSMIAKHVDGRQRAGEMVHKEPEPTELQMEKLNNNVLLGFYKDMS